MRYLLIIVGFALILAGLWWWLWPNSTVPGQGEQQRPVSGEGVLVNDPVMVGVERAPGVYEISGNEIGIDVPFTIVYFRGYDFYQISLEQEPIGETRRAAEDRLLQQLGISTEEACRLDISVRTRLEVNYVYAGTELGLSFCPGSVTLE